MFVATLANNKDLKDSQFAALASDIHIGASQQQIDPATYGGRFNARKIWETTRLAQELEHVGVFTEGSIGLGVGVGIEPLPFFLAARGVRSIGTDLYGFGWPSAPLEMLWTPWVYAPFEYRRDLLSVMQMDGMKLLMPSDSVDFVYSISSVEHFGGLRGVQSHVAEAHRILKPGGILAFSTEICISGEPTVDWCFSNREVQLLVDESGLELVNRPTVPEPELLEQPATLLLPSWTIADEEWGKLSIRYGGFVYTSAVVILRKSKPASGQTLPWPEARDGNALPD